MLFSDAKYVADAISSRIERIRDSHQMAHGCQQSWSDEKEKMFLESIQPLVDCRNILREHYARL